MEKKMQHIPLAHSWILCEFFGEQMEKISMRVLWDYFLLFSAQ